MIAAIDLGQIGKVIWVSLLSGVLITTAYALVVLGSARWLQARREGQSGTALAYGTLAVVMLAVFAAAVVIGLHIMLQKS
jgi:uncharacterized membrane protein YidH (DUF202 family)